jgi:hypothetical protein
LADQDIGRLKCDADNNFESLPIPEKSYEALKADKNTDEIAVVLKINFSIRVRATNFWVIIEGK